MYKRKYYFLNESQRENPLDHQTWSGLMTWFSSHNRSSCSSYLAYMASIENVIFLI